MGMVAIFELLCCHREIVHGRFKGSDMNPPAVRQCPNGCEPRFHPNGRLKHFELKFLRYQSEDRMPTELFATWRFPDTTSARLCRERLEARRRPAKKKAH